MPSYNVYAKQNFPCQTTSKNAKFLEFGMGRRLEENYSFCEPCFLSLFRP